MQLRFFFNVVYFGEGQTFALWPDAVHAEAPHAGGSAEVEPGRGKSCQRKSLSHTASAEGTLASGGPTSSHAAHLRTGEMHARTEDAIKIQALGAGRYFIVLKIVMFSLSMKEKSSYGLSFSRSVLSNSLQPPWTIARQAPLSMAFPRQEYWSRLPFPSHVDHPDPGIKPASPALAGRFFTTEPPGKPRICYRNTEKHLRK